jgi:signal recognition particle subunit SRP54
MFATLQEKLEDAFKKLRGQAKISESNIADAMRDIRLALLEAQPLQQLH